jgi:hypothetical protein
MGISQILPPGSQQARPTEDPLPSRDPKRYLLHLEEWLSLAASASRIPALGNRLLLVQEMAYRWDVGEVKRRASRVLADTVGEKPTTQCRHRRLTVGQDYRGGRRTARIRWWQEAPRQEASLLVDTEGLVLKVKVHSAKVPDQDGLKLLLD